jgi:hypothetical protein
MRRISKRNISVISYRKRKAKSESAKAAAAKPSSGAKSRHERRVAKNKVKISGTAQTRRQRHQANRRAASTAAWKTAA